MPPTDRELWFARLGRQQALDAESRRITTELLECFRQVTIEGGPHHRNEDWLAREQERLISELGEHLGLGRLPRAA